MYTECPECGTAFRLNAKILRQAHGRVRCGGCGSTFNAIDHLSEDLIDDNADSNPGNTQTAHVFDERSRALLESLDQLTGPGALRIEDTGVEWRVLDVEDDPGNDENPDAVEQQDATDSSPTGTIQWVLEEVDEGPVDISVTAAYSAHAADALESIGEPEAGVQDEPAYSDEIGIEAGDADGDSHAGGTDNRADLSSADYEEPDPPFESTHEPAPAESPQREVRYDDNTPLPDEFFRPSDDFPLESPAELAAAGTRPVQTVETPVTDDEPAADLAFGEIDDWQALLAEVAPEVAEEPITEKAADEPGESAAMQATSESNAGAAHSAIENSDTVVQDMDADDSAAVENSATQDSGADASGAESPPGRSDNAIPPEPPLADVPDDDNIIASEFAAEPRPPLLQLEPEPEAATETVANGDQAPSQNSDGADRRSNRDTHARDDDPDSDREDQADKGAPNVAQDFRGAATMSIAADAIGSDRDAADAELSAAMEIDQELMRAAAESRTSAHRDRRRPANEKMLFETIIMEGDTVTDLFMEADADLTSAGDRQQRTDVEADDHELGLGAATPRPSRTPLRRNLGLAAIVALSLLLAAQLIHANRGTLATRPVFENTLAPIYRALGSPVTPAWNVRGWRFESTTGSTDGAEQRLSIYSRIANKSQQPLPYPLVYVSLTDRFEEIVGSKILRPDEYLAGNASTRRPVAPGADFTAVITIDTPSPQATGFKLNVCYAAAAGQLRCAIEDFKD